MLANVVIGFRKGFSTNGICFKAPAFTQHWVSEYPLDLIFRVEPLGYPFYMKRKIPKSFPFSFDPTKRGLETFLGPTEARVLEVILGSGGGTVREIQELLIEDSSSSPAYTTIMTTLDRLFQKKLLDRKTEGKGYRYWARGDRTTLLSRLLGSILSALVREASGDSPLHLATELSDKERESLTALVMPEVQGE